MHSKPKGETAFVGQEGAVIHKVLLTHADGACKDKEEDFGFWQPGKLVLLLKLFAHVFVHEEDRDVVQYAGK